MSVEFEFCSLHYLNQWLRVERFFCDGIRSPDRVTRLQAMSSAAKHFKVARNLPAVHENGKERYAPVLDLLDKIGPRDISKRNFVERVDELRKGVSRHYGGRDVLSFVSKIMWVKFKSPIIIYDKQARQALETESGNYGQYCARWLESYSAKEDAIVKACAKLPKMRKYCVAPAYATESIIENIASKDWFRHRVFDISLWHLGAPGRAFEVDDDEEAA